MMRKELKKMHKSLLPVFLGLTLFASACEKREQRPVPEIGLPKTESMVPMGQAAPGQDTRSERDEFVSKAQKEIDELNLKLAEIKKKAERATGKAKAKLDRQIVALERELRTAEAKLVELKSAMGEKWKELKDDLTAAIYKLKQLMK